MLQMTMDTLAGIPALRWLFKRPGAEPKHASKARYPRVGDELTLMSFDDPNGSGIRIIFVDAGDHNPIHPNELQVPSGTTVLVTEFPFATFNDLGSKKRFYFGGMPFQATIEIVDRVVHLKGGGTDLSFDELVSGYPAEVHLCGAPQFKFKVLKLGK